VAVDDSGATNNYQPLVLTADYLLANDYDIDDGDQIALSWVSDTSLLGASVEVVRDETQQIQEVIYDPRTSDELMQLAVGQQVVDEFTYEIVDQHGASDTARVRITVTGQAFTIEQVPLQLILVGESFAPIALVLTGFGGDASELLVTAAVEYQSIYDPQQNGGDASDPELIPADGLQVSGTGDTRTLTITSTQGIAGRAWITVTAFDALERSATMSFPVIVGIEGDRDLDGVPDSVEDAGPNGGDSSGDGIPDSWQPHVASLPGYDGQTYVSLSVPPGHFLANVSSAASPSPSGPAANAQFPLGLVHYQVVLGEPGASSEITFRTDLATPVVNRYFQHQGPGDSPEDWQFLMHDTRDGACVYADRIEVTLRDGGRADQDGSANGLIVGTAALASVDNPWQNLRPEDVNNDGIVSPLDVLILINTLNLVGGPLELGARPTEGNVLPAFLDPSGNHLLEPADVLQVINYVNFALAGGEGEFWAEPEVGTLAPAADALWRSDHQHQETSSTPRSRTMDEWAYQLPGRSDSAWSDRVFRQLGETSSRFHKLLDELFDELIDELGAAAINLVPTGGNGLTSTSAAKAPR
jgi:hypothetical protein